MRAFLATLTVIAGILAQAYGQDTVRISNTTKAVISPIPFRVGQSATDPTAPGNGSIWYDTINNTLDARINGATVNLGSGGTITGADTRVLFFDGANTPAGDPGFSYNKTTNTATVDTLDVGNFIGDVTFDGDVNAASGTFTGLFLGTASALDGSLILRRAANALTTTLKTGVTGASYTLTLPTTDGANGEFLQTNGSGVLTWAAGGGAITGADTQVLFFDGVDNPAGEAVFSYAKGASVLSVPNIDVENLQAETIGAATNIGQGFFDYIRVNNIEFAPDGFTSNGVSKGVPDEAKAGTISVTIGTADVVGVGTAFLTDFPSGSAIKIADEVFTVSGTPASDTALTLSANHAAGAAGVVAYAQGNLWEARDPSGNVDAFVDQDGRFHAVSLLSMPGEDITLSGFLGLLPIDPPGAALSGIKLFADTTELGWVKQNGNVVTLTATGATSVTLPTSGTLATLDGTEAFTNKTYNGNTITTGTGTLTLAAGKTLTASNTLTLAGTDGSALNIGTGGTLGTAAYTASTAYVTPTTLNNATLPGAFTTLSATGQILASDGTAAAPGMSFSTAQTGFRYSAASGIMFCASSADIWRTSASSIAMRSNGSYAWSSTTDPAAGGDLFLFRDAAATLQMGVDHATAAIGQKIKGPDTVTGTGGSLTLAGGTGTSAVGSAIILNGGISTTAGGSIVFQTAVTGTLTDRLTIAATGGAVFSSALQSLGVATLSELNIGAGWWYGGQGAAGGIGFGSGHGIYWKSATTATSVAGGDTGVSRISAGLVGLGTGAAGSFAGNVKATGAELVGNLTMTGATSVVRLKGYTVATLPAGTQGDTAFCTDLTTPTYGATAVGGGAVVGKVFYNGSAWITD